MRIALLFMLLSTAPALAADGLHPLFPLRDTQGEVTTDPVVATPEATCGACHDVEYIRGHSGHQDAQIATDCFRCHVPGGALRLATDHLDDGLVRYRMRPPTDETCGSCHGLVHEEAKPLELPAGYVEGRDPSPTARTLCTGEVFSGQMISTSFLNLAGKADLDRPWDIHASRRLGCVACHAAANNPALAASAPDRGPEHLRRDPRSLGTEDYLRRPDHRLTSIGCAACHDPAAAHPDMPYLARHMEALSCQACHVPALAAPAAQVIDATVVTRDGGPRLELRGVEDPAGHPNTWYTTGYVPFLLYETDAARFAPYNLVSRWAWTDQAGVPVAEELLRAAWLDASGAHHPDLIESLDRDGDGALATTELLLDTPERVRRVATRLEALGVVGPEIRGTVDAEAVLHGVAEGRWIGGDCDGCHGPRSRLNTNIALAGVFPGGVAPEPSEALTQRLGAHRLEVDGGRAVLRSDAAPPGRYIPGMSRAWTDAVGFLLFALTLLGVTAHGLRRFLLRRRAAVHATETRREYLYNTYERLWHWVMAFSVLLLLVTGLHIHYPGGTRLFAFPTAVLVHNVTAAVMLVNAFLALFYHLSTNEIRQFIPEGAGLVGRLRAQAGYYLHGIFQGAAHPSGKSRDRKLNPLQQLTYAGLLNVLFPLQIGTGLLLWLAGIAPGTAAALGGLSVLTPIHNLGSWLFLSFLVAHVYLTTTGHTVLTNLRAMIDGWEDVEVSPDAAPGGADA